MKSSAALQNIDRPIASLFDEYPPGTVDDWHDHRRNQLIYATSGVMSVMTDKGSFVIPPQRALWVPAGIRHHVTALSHVTLKTLYIDSLEHQDWARKCRVFGVTELLRALINQAVEIPPLYELDSRDGRIMQLILDEIACLPIDPLSIPMPAEPRLAKICTRFINEPTLQLSLDQWADAVGMSRRSFTRSFREQSDMSFIHWCTQVRLVKAISLMAAGKSVSQVAFEVGYNSISAYTTAFHKAFGLPPSKYLLVHFEAF